MSKLLVERCARLCIWELIREKKLDAKSLLSSGSLDVTINIKVGILETEKSIRETLYFTYSNTNFNGRRVWFKCPYCNRRVGCLYIPFYSDKVLCRQCHNLAYSSQNLHRNRFLDYFQKFERKQKKIEKKLDNKWLRIPTKMKLICSFLNITNKAKEEMPKILRPFRKYLTR